MLIMHIKAESLTIEREQHRAGSDVGAAVNHRFVAASRKGVFSQRSQFKAVELILQNLYLRCSFQGRGRVAQVPVCIR